MEREREGKGKKGQSIDFRTGSATWLDSTTGADRRRRDWVIQHELQAEKAAYEEVGVGGERPSTL